jgi:lysophospholipid acyltransferase (LPLAT)-like uncharacterized protein
MPITPGSVKPRRRRSGVVVPHRAVWHQRLLARLIYGGIRGVEASLRFRMDDREGLLTRVGGERLIFAIWHNRLALSLSIYNRYVRRADPARRLAAMVSASRDGGLLTRILELFEVQPVRGSSSRRGPQALRELTGWAERGYDLAITPDGPRGPCYHVQEGVISLAQLTGLPIVPASVTLSAKVKLPSWDRFQLPLPLACCETRLGEMLRVDRAAGEEEREVLRQQLEERLRGLTSDWRDTDRVGE